MATVEIQDEGSRKKTKEKIKRGEKVYLITSCNSRNSEKNE